MRQQTETALVHLYEADETAWLEEMAELIRQRRLDDLDYAHLREYLQDMAKRDRREVKNRLIVLLTHVLKWVYQAKKRSASWRGTIVAQRQELADLIESGVLRIHAEEVFAGVYPKAIERAATETKLPVKTFPKECPFTLDELLAPEVLDTSEG